MKRAGRPPLGAALFVYPRTQMKFDQSSRISRDMDDGEEIKLRL
jgi:hypothetical protein